MIALRIIFDFLVYHLPRFLRNVFLFRRELIRHEWWDYYFTLMMLQRSLQITRDGLEKKGSEVIETKQLKINKISRAVEIIDHILDNSYEEMAENKLGKKYTFAAHGALNVEQDNKEIIDLAVEIEDSEWQELWKILNGQNILDLKNSNKSYEEWYDGSGMRGWWD